MLLYSNPFMHPLSFSTNISFCFSTRRYCLISTSAICPPPSQDMHMKHIQRVSSTFMAIILHFPEMRPSPQHKTTRNVLAPNDMLAPCSKVSPNLPFNNSSKIFSFHYTERSGDRGSTVVKVLCYKSEGCWFDPSWCHWNFSLI